LAGGNCTVISTRVIESPAHFVLQTCVRFPRVLGTGIGWPDRSGRAVGSRSDKKLRRAGATIINYADIAIGYAWCGLLSHRDPAGTNLSVGAPARARATRIVITRSISWSNPGAGGTSEGFILEVGGGTQCTMPEGLVKQLTLDQFVDLIAFLTSQRATRAANAAR